MGLNSLFRRLTENRSSTRCRASKPADLNGNNLADGLSGVSASNPDILYSSGDSAKRSNRKKIFTPLSADYPSCPTLAVPPSEVGGISGCCTSSSSYSLVTHRQTQEKHQWFSRRKSGSLFMRARRSAATTSSDQQRQSGAESPSKKLSWLPTSSPFLRVMTSNASIPTLPRLATPQLPALPAPILLKCLDAVQDPFQLFRLRALNSAATHHVDSRVGRVIDMDVRKVNFDDVTVMSSTSTAIFENKVFYAHPAGHRVLMRFADDGRRVDILVDDCWTSRDVVRLCRILNAFRLKLTRIALDAQIFELVIANLSVIDLDRWYAFQCYMKAVNDFQLHLAVFEHPHGAAPEDFYWPLAESLTIRSTEQDTAHLSRVLDYGVRSRLVMDRRRLETLKIILTDVEKTNRALVRNLYRFRCWAGSAGFDDRFSQQCCLTSVAKDSSGTAAAVGNQRATVLC